LKEIQKILYSTEVRFLRILPSNRNSDTPFAHRKDLRYQRRWQRTKRSRLLAERNGTTSAIFNFRQDLLPLVVLLSSSPSNIQVNLFIIHPYPLVTVVFIPSLISEQTPFIRIRCSFHILGASETLKTISVRTCPCVIDWTNPNQYFRRHHPRFVM